MPSLEESNGILSFVIGSFLIFMQIMSNGIFKSPPYTELWQTQKGWGCQWLCWMSLSQSRKSGQWMAWLMRKGQDYIEMWKIVLLSTLSAFRKGWYHLNQQKHDSQFSLSILCFSSRGWGFYFLFRTNWTKCLSLCYWSPVLHLQDRLRTFLVYIVGVFWIALSHNCNVIWMSLCDQMTANDFPT